MIIKNYINNILKKNSPKLSNNFENIYQKILSDINNPIKTLNVLSDKLSYNFKKKEIEKYKKFKTLAIIGMGGSILGTKAIFNFLETKINKKVYFFDDLNENKMLKFKKKEVLSNVLFIVVSKSGNTIETLTNFYSLKILKKNAKNIIIISERKNNLLFNLSKNLNLHYIEHKKNIGGRYSVLSEVGLVPAYLMGVNIEKLRSNLLSFLNGVNKEVLKESSILLSSILNLKKKNNIVFLNYSPELEQFLFWCQQLIAESLGKDSKGFFPVISNVPKDHHSLLQLYLDGPKDKLFYLFSTETKSKININVNKNIQDKNILNKKSLNLVKNAQKTALIKTLLRNKMPVREFKIKKINEKTLGSLFSYFILETIFIARLSKINPFNQPAVEQVKIFTNQILKH